MSSHNSHGHINDKPFPRGALLGAGALVGFCLALTAAFTWGGMGAMDAAKPGPAETVMALNFVDREAGGVAVIDAADGSTLTVLEPGTHGFIRGVMRGLVRVRRLHGLGDEAAFVLSRAQDGGLWLHDPATDESVYLGAFGDTNEQAFAVILKQQENRS